MNRLKAATSGSIKGDKKLRLSSIIGILPFILETYGGFRVFADSFGII